MHRTAILFALCMMGCSSTETSNPAPVDAATDTGSATTNDTGSASDVTSPTGDAAACPASAPEDMAPCEHAGQLCEYPIDCGPQAGTFATCTNAKWNVVKRPCTTGDTGGGG